MNRLTTIKNTQNNNFNNKKLRMYAHNIIETY